MHKILLFSKKIIIIINFKQLITSALTKTLIGLPPGTDEMQLNYFIIRT